MTPAPRPLQVTVSLLVKLNISMCPFLGQIYFQQKTHVLQFGCALTQLFLNLFLMSDFCKFSIIIIISPFPKIKILVPNLLKSRQEPYPLKQSWDILFLVFDVHICSSVGFVLCSSSDNPHSNLSCARNACQPWIPGNQSINSVC